MGYQRVCQLDYLIHQLMKRIRWSDHWEKDLELRNKQRAIILVLLLEQGS